MAPVAPLLTAEEYGRRPDDGRFTELVRGRVVATSFPTWRHGVACSRLIGVVGDHVVAHDLGHVAALSGIITERHPDTVRGADVSFFSYDRLPRGRLPDGYLPVAPELVFEVRDDPEPWSVIRDKVGEFLAAGVLAVCVLDPEARTLDVHRADQSAQVLTTEDELILPDLLPDFRVPVRRFFE